MSERRHRSATAQVGLVFAVFCSGLAGGSVLATGRVSSPSAVIDAASAGAPVGPTDRASTPGAQNVSWPGDSMPRGSRYVPVGQTLGRKDVSSAVPQAGDVIADAPPLSNGSYVPEASSMPGPTVPPDSGGTPDRPTDDARRLDRRSDDQVAGLGAARAAEAALFAISVGNQTVLFEVGVPGAAGLPNSIRGAWAWVGTCEVVQVVISQLPGGERGSVRAVAHGSSVERFGWVVPRAGCRGASGRFGGAEVGSETPRIELPREVRELRDVGELPCAPGRACLWFAGLDGRGRPVGLLIRSGTDEWISLRQGAPGTL